MGIPESNVSDAYVDVMMKVHGSIQKFRGGGPAKLTTWIYRVARNVANDHHRASKTNNAAMEFDEATVSHSQEMHGACAGRNHELLKWLNQELLKFSEQDRFLLKWRAMEIPYAQIGEWLGMSEGTARVRYLRAMEKLSTAAKSIISEEGAVPR
jgi:RNA polymerase sigma-70 factor, ECF subfamily